MDTKSINTVWIVFSFLLALSFLQTTSSALKGAIQLGIGYTVGNLTSKPDRDVLMQDFYVVESVFLPRSALFGERPTLLFFGIYIESTSTLFLIWICFRYIACMCVSLITSNREPIRWFHTFFCSVLIIIGILKRKRYINSRMLDVQRQWITELPFRDGLGVGGSGLSLSCHGSQSAVEIHIKGAKACTVVLFLLHNVCQFYFGRDACGCEEGCHLTNHMSSLPVIMPATTLYFSHCAESTHNRAVVITFLDICSRSFFNKKYF